MDNNWVTFSDLIRPVGSVYFSSSNRYNFDPSNIFGGTWVNSGTIIISGETYNVWHRET